MLRYLNQKKKQTHIEQRVEADKNILDQALNSTLKLSRRLHGTYQ